MLDGLAQRGFGMNAPAGHVVTKFVGGPNDWGWAAPSTGEGSTGIDFYDTQTDMLTMLSIAPTITNGSEAVDLDEDNLSAIGNTEQPFFELNESEGTLTCLRTGLYSFTLGGDVVSNGYDTASVAASINVFEKGTTLISVVVPFGDSEEDDVINVPFFTEVGVVMAGDELSFAYEGTALLVDVTAEFTCNIYAMIVKAEES